MTFSTTIFIYGIFYEVVGISVSISSYDITIKKKDLKRMDKIAILA